MPASPQRFEPAYYVAAGAGMAIWFGVCAVTGRKEAWDADLYWSGAYPVALAVCAALGFVFPRRPWRWALTLFLAQFVAMLLRSGEIGSLWPLGLILFGALSLPGMLAAKVAARFGRAEAPPPDAA